MATIYQKDGQSLYDLEGVTYSANTGQPLSGTTPPPDPFRKEPTVVTSSSAREATKDSINTLNTYNTNLSLSQQQKAQQQAPQPNQQAEEPLVLVDPNTLQRITFANPSINKDGISPYLQKGYSVESGALPANLAPTSSTPTSAEQAVQNANSELEALYKGFDNLHNLTPTQNAYIGTIKDQFDTRRRQLEDLNRREQASLSQFGIASGAMRHSASFDSVITDAERQGLQRLQELDAQELSLIAEAQRAFEADNFKSLVEKINLATEIADRKQAELDNIQKAALEQNKLLTEQMKAQNDYMQNIAKNKQMELDYMTGYAEAIAPVALASLTGDETADIETITSMAQQYGIDPNVLLGAVQTLSDAPTKSVPAEFNLLANFLGRKPTQKEYMEFVQSLRPPASSGNSLTPYQQAQSFTGISNKYQSDTFINNALKGQNAIIVARQVLADPENATNQLKALYSLVKNLDPDSAVREGELALASQTQSYFANFDNYYTRISQGRVVSPEVAKQMANATIELANAWNETAKRRQAQYKAQAQVAGVGDQFNQYLAGFDSEFTQTSTGIPSGNIVTAPDGTEIEIVD